MQSKMGSFIAQLNFRNGINRERLGLGINLDYRPNDDNDFYLRSLFSQYDDSERRNASAVEWEDGLTSGMTGTAEVKRSLKARTEEQNIQSYVFGGESRLGVDLLDRRK